MEAREVGMRNLCRNVRTENRNGNFLVKLEYEL